MDVNTIRFLIFLATLLVLATLEVKYPRRELAHSKSARWFVNLTLTVVDGVLVKLILGAAAVGVAGYAKSQGWGLINYLELPWIAGFFIGFLFLDVMVYLMHVIAYALPFLWRFHIVHHTDLDFDVTTALRFHPLEILIAMGYKIMLVVAIGADPWTVMIFEIVLNASAQFNHTNLNIPKELDEKIRKVVVTPDFHRVHHSVEVDETNSNFGFFLSWWDKLFGTYKPQPLMEHTEMDIGVDVYRDSADLSIGGVLMLPLKPRMGHYSMHTDN